MISEERKKNVLKINLFDYLEDVCPTKVKRQRNGNLAFISQSVDLAIFEYDKDGRYNPHGCLFQDGKRIRKDFFDVIKIVQGLDFPKAVEALEKWGLENNVFNECEEDDDPFISPVIPIDIPDGINRIID